MMLATAQTAQIAPDIRALPWPAEVDFILSALEAGPRPSFERHKLPRISHRVVASLDLFSDLGIAPPTLLYTRNVNVQALSFLTPRHLPLSHGGTVSIPSLDRQRLLEIQCTILRCREAAPGWFEGAVYFNRTQLEFAPVKLAR